MKEWRYDWIWKKNTSAGFVHAKNRPLKNYEIISAFCRFGMGHKSTMGEKRMPYNPQGLRPCHKVSHNALNKFGGVVGKRPSHKDTVVTEWENYPTAILEFNVESDSFHPTQKPVALIQYLIRTYSNDGDTIPPEELSLVFDRFHKTDKSRSQNRDGWGLGLYIVKTIVCSHGENISVTSRDGKTEFTFTMPLVN